MRKYSKAILMIIIMLMTFTILKNTSFAGATAGFSAWESETMQEAGAPGAGSVTASGDTQKQDKQLTDLYDPIQNPDFFKPSKDESDSTKLQEMANSIIGALRAIGTIAAVVILMIMGYKYMIGTVEEKASFKQSMIPYLVGAIMLFTIPTFVGLIYDLVKGISF